MSGHRNLSNDAPLLAWGDALRARKTQRMRLRRHVLAVGAGIGVVLLSAALPPAPHLVWNASASAPVGLYSVEPGAVLEPGDMAIARVPQRYRHLAASRRYLPLNVPLVKRVAAYAGDEICALENRVFINGRWAAERRQVDAAGRSMPTWTGCLVLRGRQLFLLMDSPASFDGRYFGPTEGADVIGKAKLLWRR
ncbi:S26 family signal peptidase [uncultured Novosphingobium sp.]|uniref:S26 family signal peptidase n=1 Tax=uncultured Novosphingobium sp. TaxID=292277 RepID=UPI00258FBEB3|nr:S26 family signal peptidase [uncultured Novosphingobium sp.]